MQCPVCEAQNEEDTKKCVNCEWEFLVCLPERTEKDIKNYNLKVQKAKKIWEGKKKVEIPEVKVENMPLDINANINGSEEANKTTYITPEDISNAEGNYLFTIGAQSCGKSSLQTAMLYQFHEDRKIALDYNSDNPRHTLLLTDYILNFKNQRLPLRTDDGKVQQFKITITPTDSGIASSLNFLEISGEDIRKIQPSKDNPNPFFNTQLEDFLLNKKVKPSFLFLYDPTKKDDEAFLQEQLLAFFVQYISRDEIKRNNNFMFLFVITKSDTINKETYPDAQTYIYQNLPNLKPILENMNDFDYLYFSLGRLDEANSLHLKTYDSHSIEVVNFWIMNNILTSVRQN